MYSEFAPYEIKPEGWLRDQLRLEAEGLVGHLDKFWPDIMDSGWIGGKHEGWERVPYWLDGFLPLGFLLEDDDLIARGKFYMETILHRQQEDGWICPCAEEARQGYDQWAHFLFGKVLVEYYEYTRDERYANALYRDMKALFAEMRKPEARMHSWGYARWADAMIPLCFLYDRTKESWIRDFADLIRDLGIDWTSFREEWKTPSRHVYLQTHIVNIAMMFKYQPVYAALFGKEPDSTAEEIWQYLKQYHGNALDAFNGDEHLAGVGPSHGFELCSVCELMYSYELLYFITGDPVWADRLEKVAFNALPATISDDMWRHQYDQMTNQISASLFEEGHVYLQSNGERAMLFGIEPQYGCCTANMAQGWPKLALHAYRKTDNGAEIVLLLPSSLKTKINEKPVNITVETEYPFRHDAKITVSTEEPVSFPLTIRVPGSCDGIICDGKKYTDRYLTVDRTWTGTTTLSLSLLAEPHLKERPNGLYCAEYGPLVFSLPLAFREHLLEKRGDEYFADEELLSDDEWRYGFADSCFKVLFCDGDEIPFSSKNPRIRLEARLSRVDWNNIEGYPNLAEQTPVCDKALSAPETFALFPYGCAKLRMTEMPKTK